MFLVPLLSNGWNVYYFAFNLGILEIMEQSDWKLTHIVENVTGILE